MSMHSTQSCIAKKITRIKYRENKKNRSIFMNKTLKKITSILFFLIPICTHATTVTPFYSIRSQGVDAARELAGWTQHVNLFDMEKLYGSISLTPEYTRSFRSNDINSALFGVCDEKPLITVSGSQTANRGANDWLADYFYLPTDFVSNLGFKPVIDNFIFDINCYLGLDEWVNGLFVRLHLPIVHTRWKLNFCEHIINPGTNAYDAGYFAAAPIARSNLLARFSHYASGKTPQGVTDTILNPLKFAKITNTCNNTKTRLAELQAVLGWNFMSDENYHFGVGLRFSAPTGSKPEAEYLFEPLAGNGKHWELGAHITSHVMLWRSDDENSSLGFYCDANITHLFNAKQIRTFDLKNKPLSRYMLAEKLGSPIAGIAGGPNNGITIPSAQFQKEFSPVANLTTSQVSVSCDIQADVAAQLTYVVGGFAWDMGYNFWARSCEKFSDICQRPCPSTLSFEENTWALKGDAYVVGFVENSTDPVALSATESHATLNSGTNFAASGIGNNSELLNADKINTYIDAPQLTWNGLDSVVPLVATPNGIDQTRTSIQPIFIKDSDIDRVGVQGLSNKLYMNFSYQWVQHEDTVPFIGLGLFAEFGSPFSSCKSDSSSCGFDSSSSSSSCGDATCGDACANYAVSQWGVWLKGGVSFN